MQKAEFDKFADEYYSDHAKNIRASGESPEFFHEYKIADVAEAAPATKSIIDFGSGIGNSIAYWRKHFPGAQLTCAEVSSRSIELSKSRFPGAETYLQVGEKIPADDNSFDLAFSACVFHHIDHADHDFWLRELLRVVAPGGSLFIFEHNPLNPLTVHAVNTCPFDENAHLIPAKQLKRSAEAAGWVSARTPYRIFFPGLLGSLRPLERYMVGIPFGAQYYLQAFKPAGESRT